MKKLWVKLQIRKFYQNMRQPEGESPVLFRGLLVAWLASGVLHFCVFLWLVCWWGLPPIYSGLGARVTPNVPMNTDKKSPRNTYCV